MNYAQARQRSFSDGTPQDLWDWSTMNDGRAWVSNPCNHSCRHATREEAERHFYDYCLEQAQVHPQEREMRRCRVCNAWTRNQLGNIQMWLLLQPEWLCDAHLTREFLAQVQPFAPGYTLVHS